MLNGLKQKWDRMKPQNRHRATLFLVFGVFIVASALVFGLTGEKKKPTVQIADTKKTITIDPKLLEKTMTVKADEQAGKIDVLEKQIAEMKKSGMSPIVATSNPIAQPNSVSVQEMAVLGKEVSHKSKGKGGSNFPPLPEGTPPFGQNIFGTLPPPPGATGDISAPPIQREVIGEIEIATNPGYKAGSITPGTSGNVDPDKKKGERDIYLPPSYVEATLMNGLYAPTAEGARGNPVPVLLRIRDLAQLPNEVKANIKGCFIISEGVGNLSDERAHLRLKSLSCISKSGESVIDQSVKGFVVDSDGKLGVSGTVVSKMGATITRSIIAGFFSGFGDALKQSSQYQSQSAGIYGTSSVMTTDLGHMALAGAGSGISAASNDLAKFYLELSKQTMPVIEVGAAKRVTLVFSEGTILKVKEFKRSKNMKKQS
jgi:conjugal transfer pilus assembly protein TraB